MVFFLGGCDASLASDSSCALLTMPRHAHPYPFARNQCGYCDQAFPTMTGVRRHISHSPRCQAAALRNAARRHTVRGDQGGDQGVNSEVRTDDEGNGEGVDIDVYPDPNPGDGGALDDHDRPVHSEFECDSTNAKTSRRYAREYDEGCAADVLGSAETAFERMKDLQEASGQGTYAPFADRSEWELADWLVKNANQRATDEFLKLPIVSHINRYSE